MTEKEIKTKTIGILTKDIKKIAKWKKDDIEKYLYLILLESDWSELRDLNQKIRQGFITSEDWAIEFASALGLTEYKGEPDVSPSDFAG